MKTDTRRERLERAGIPPLYGREFRSLVPAKPRGVEAARSMVDAQHAQVRAATGDTGSIIEGTGTVYDVWYQIGNYYPFREKFVAGAFNKTIADGADVRSMLNHDPGRLLGRTKSKTLDLSSDANALNYLIRVNDTDPLAVSAHAQVLRGDIDGSSIWFSVVSEQWTFATEDNGLDMDEVIITEAKLYELGPVVFPANEATVSSARSLDALARGMGVEDMDTRRQMVLSALEDPDSALEAFRRALGVEKLPDLRALCDASGNGCSCRGQGTPRAADEARPDPAADEAPERSLELMKLRHSLNARKIA